MAKIRQVVGFPGYFVGTDGSFWTKWKSRGKKGRGFESYIGDKMEPMSPQPSKKNRYVRLRFRKDGKYHARLAHRMVLETFVGPCPDGMECLHGDNDRSNNQLSNLRWGRRKMDPEVVERRSAKLRGVPKTEAHRSAIKATHWSKGPKAAETAAKIALKKRQHDAAKKAA